MSWQNQPLAIPPLPPSIMNSKLISIKYIVHVFVVVPMGFDIDFNFPITIGTVPFIPRYDGWLPDEKAMIPQHRSGAIIFCVCMFVLHPLLIPSRGGRSWVLSSLRPRGHREPCKEVIELPKNY